MSTWNKKNFSIYTSDERSALGLIEELGNQTNYNTQELEKVKESDNKKVSHDEMNNIYKIDKNADFTGSWHGIKKPTASQEGLQATVEKHIEDIADIRNNIATHKVLFMPVGETDSAAGDCSCIITKNGKVIIIDTGATHSYNLIRANLNKYGVNKIDYVFITHYHADHCQNLQSLIADYDMTSTIYYLQKHSEKYQYADSTVLSLIGSNEKNYPNNGDKLIIDQVQFTFFNCSQIDIDYYDTNSTNYNDYSMCCYCEVPGTKILFTGDINLKAQSRMNDQGYFKKVDLLKVEHHAYDSTVNHDYIRKVNPKYGVVSESEKAFTNKANVISETLSLLNGLGCDVACTGKELVTFNFNEYGHEFIHNYNVGGCFKDVSNYTYIYVDSTHKGFSDGTYHNPYRSIREALSEAYKLKSLNVQIYPKKDTFESDEHIRIANFNGTIKLDRITVRACDIRNSHVIFGSFTVTGSQNRALMMEGSIVEFSNLVVNGDVRSVANEYDARGIGVYKSKFIGSNLEISNKRIALCSYNGSDVYIGTLSGTNNQYGLLCVSGSKIITNKVTMSFETSFKDLQKTSYIDGALKNDLDRYLVEGDDLDLLKVPGTRFVSKTGAITLTLLNKPTNIGYSMVLEVKKQTEDGSIMQVIRSRHLNNVNGSTSKTGIWIRTYNYTDGWSSWYELSLK